MSFTGHLFLPKSYSHLQHKFSLKFTGKNTAVAETHSSCTQMPVEGNCDTVCFVKSTQMLKRQAGVQGPPGLDGDLGRQKLLELDVL